MRLQHAGISAARTAPVPKCWAALAGLVLGLLAQNAAAQCYNFPDMPRACAAGPSPPACDASCFEARREANRAAADARSAQDEIYHQNELNHFNQLTGAGNAAMYSGDNQGAVIAYQQALEFAGQARYTTFNLIKLRAAYGIARANVAYRNNDLQTAIKVLEDTLQYDDRPIVREYLQAWKDQLARPQAGQRAAAEVAQIRQNTRSDVQAGRIAEAQARADIALANWKAQPAVADPAVLQGKRDAAGLMAAASGGTTSAFGVRETGPVNVGAQRTNQTQTYATASAQLGGAAGSANDLTRGNLPSGDPDAVKAASDCVFTGGGANCHASAPLPVSHGDPVHFHADDLGQQLGPRVASNDGVRAALGFYRNAEANTRVKENEIATAERALTPQSTPEQRMYVDGLRKQLKDDKQAEAAARGQVKTAVLNLGVAMP